MTVNIFQCFPKITQIRLYKRVARMEKVFVTCPIHSHRISSTPYCYNV